ncbi:MAG: NAD(P)/FAD-dependent oxidoreductase [Clostridia bacterium]|nr:NAD(P)/FAD-dependent oxidoreductase [Clostridia bacterium]
MIEKLAGVRLPVGANEEQLLCLAQKKLHAPVRYFKILKKSLDARDKNKLQWIYTVEFSAQKQSESDPLAPLGEAKERKKQILVVGAGPAGLFCAVRLLQWGFCPLVVERGAPVEERERDIQAFFDTGVLNTQSNVQFGEGGAGTFSDGKLNTQTNSLENAEVLRLFVAFGAPQEIAYLNKPHIGSDNLKKVIQNMRRYILAQGGKIAFHTALIDVNKTPDGKLNAHLSTGEKIEADDIVLAVGHSARDTFSMLESKGVCLQQKEFAVGVRIEHLQSKISFSQYGSAYTKLPPADYKLVSHVKDRAAFTFCMCPGGYVMPATSEEYGVVTNGMSNYLRNEMNANAALIVQIKKEDFASDAPLAGIAFQRKLEQAAYRLGGGDYRAPVQRVEDFLQNRPSHGAGEVLPSYARGVTYTNLNGLFSLDVAQTLASSISDMGRRLKGFDHADALLTGVESRTSSPVRILRDEQGESVTLPNVYPCGEGAGYAGGITSAAADGLRTATKIARKYGANV